MYILGEIILKFCLSFTKNNRTVLRGLKQTDKSVISQKNGIRQMNSYLSVIYHSDPFYFIFPVNVCSTLSMMCVCVCVCVCVCSPQPANIHSFINSFNCSIVHSLFHSFIHSFALF